MFNEKHWRCLFGCRFFFPSSFFLRMFVVLIIFTLMHYYRTTHVYSLNLSRVHCSVI